MNSSPQVAIQVWSANQIHKTNDNVIALTGINKIVLSRSALHVRGKLIFIYNQVVFLRRTKTNKTTYISQTQMQVFFNADNLIPNIAGLHVISGSCIPVHLVDNYTNWKRNKVDVDAFLNAPYPGA